MLKYYKSMRFSHNPNGCSTVVERSLSMREVPGSNPGPDFALGVTNWVSFLMLNILTFDKLCQQFFRIESNCDKANAMK